MTDAQMSGLEWDLELCIAAEFVMWPRSAPGRAGTSSSISGGSLMCHARAGDYVREQNRGLQWRVLHEGLGLLG